MWNKIKRLAENQLRHAERQLELMGVEDRPNPRRLEYARITQSDAKDIIGFCEEMLGQYNPYKDRSYSDWNGGKAWK